MPVLHINAHGDGAWGDLAAHPERIIQIPDEQPIEVSALARGMASGKPSVAFRIDLPDGRVVFAQTSLALFLTAAEVFLAAHGDPRT